MSACIVGWSHTPFARHEGVDIEALIDKVVGAALADAGVAAADIDEVYVGHFNAGFSKQDFPSSLVFQGEPNLRFKPTTRVENACATGSAAIHVGLKSIAAKRSRTAWLFTPKNRAPRSKIGSRNTDSRAPCARKV